MKRRICLIIAGIILVAILAFAFYKLSAGDSFEKTLVSSEWYVQMSEGTTAVYTFHKNGTFDCEAHIALGEQEASMTRSGTYAVDKDESGAPPGAAAVPERKRARGNHLHGKRRRNGPHGDRGLRNAEKWIVKYPEIFRISGYCSALFRAYLC